jgi:hypothetical protein
MERREYNGWTNYETWNLNLWLGEDTGEMWTERAQELLDEAREEDLEGEATLRAHAAIRLAEEIESDVTASAPELSGFYADILSAALGEVNFQEIAEHYVSDCEYEAPTDED